MTKLPKTTTAPTGQIAPFGLRMLPELRVKVEQAAREAGRSMNAEIVSRLEASFQEHHPKDFFQDATLKMLNTEVERLTKELRETRSASSPLMAKVGDTMEMMVRQVMKERHLSFEDAMLLITTRGMAFEEAAPALIIQVAQGTPLSEVRALMETLKDYSHEVAYLSYEQVEGIEATRLLTTNADKGAFLEAAKPHPKSK